VLNQFNYSVEEMNDYYRYDMKADEIKNRIAAGAVKGKVEGLMEGLAEGEARGKTKAIRNMIIELSHQASIKVSSPRRRSYHLRKQNILRPNFGHNKKEGQFFPSSKILKGWLDEVLRAAIGGRVFT
jgi:hypothetical protein